MPFEYGNYYRSWRWPTCLGGYMSLLGLYNEWSKSLHSSSEWLMSLMEKLSIWPFLYVCSSVYRIWPAGKGNGGSYCGWCSLLQKVARLFFFFTALSSPVCKYKFLYVCVSVSLHSQTDRLFALSRLKQSGAYLTTTEAVMLQLVQGAKHPNFKEVQTTACTPKLVSICHKQEAWQYTQRKMNLACHCRWMGC